MQVINKIYNGLVRLIICFLIAATIMCGLLTFLAPVSKDASNTLVYISNMFYSFLAEYTILGITLIIVLIVLLIPKILKFLIED